VQEVVVEEVVLHLLQVEQVVMETLVLVVEVVVLVPHLQVLEGQEDVEVMV
jgi:hypothetical protein